MHADKVRIRFRKAGYMRLVSHHDLMRCWERMLRRAAIPFHSTGGFNPKPRLVFALSLGLGIVGCNEVVELELDEIIPAGEMHDRLARQAPPGLEILSVRRIPPKTTAQVRRAGYRLPLAAGQATAVRLRADTILARPDLWVERQRPTRRRLNIRPYLQAIRVLDDAVELDFWVTPTGTARPDDLLDHLGLAGAIEQGAVLQRVFLELYDEVDSTAAPPPALVCPPDQAEQPDDVGSGGPPVEPEERRPPPGRTAPQSLLPGPLDY
jgi:radical SAM-linked protein